VRKRTLRPAIDWSYGRLTDRQQLLHGTLAVFSDGAALEDARAVAPDASVFLTDLEALVGWSLLRSEASDGSVRLSMLETVREHALAHLKLGGDLDRIRDKHADRSVELASIAEPELVGPDQARWLDRLEQEFDNLSAALEWLLTSGRTEDALRTAAGLSRFWRAHGYGTEARLWLTSGLEQGDAVPVDVRADAHWAAARQAAAQSDWQAAEEHLVAVLPLFRERGREREVAFTLAELAFVAIRREDLHRAAELCEEALALGRKLGDARATSAALLTLAEIRSVQGNHDVALAHNEEALALRRRLGDPLLVTDAVRNLGWVTFVAGEHARSRSALEESLALAQALGDELHAAEALRLLGELDLLAGDADSAETRLEESLTLSTEAGADLDRAACLVGLGGVAALRGSNQEAARLFDEAASLRGESAPEAPEREILARFRAG
jgi:non-specific serine/threonine protein kinase